MQVDEQTLNITGLRADRSRRDELILRVAASAEPNAFTLYEDDGVSTAYQTGAVRTTEINQQQNGNRVTVIVAAAQGTYDGALTERDTILQLITREGGEPQRVTLNGMALEQALSEAEFEAMPDGWYYAAPTLVLVKTGLLGVEIQKSIEVHY
jgi:alpha-glucosidase